MSIRHLILSTTTAVSTIVLSPCALAQSDLQSPNRQLFDLEEQTLGEALRAVARANNHQLVADPSVLAGRKAPRLKGKYAFDEAIRLLLEGSGLEAEITGTTVFIRTTRPGKAISAQQNEDIEVTGSRIRGAQSISPLIRLTTDEMREGGITTLADAIRTIPQNFNGGQNPAIGLGVPESRGSYIGGGTGLNLRGLGSDATLTLLNGHRLSYNGVRQSVDISAIPFMAIDRIEVMTDGASAIYGSDAVAGVANIILRNSFEGLATSARFSASTDGGNERQQYGALAGHNWSRGNIMLAMDWQKATPVLSRQRDYAAQRAPGLTLLPAYRNVNFLMSGRQDITDFAELRVDGIYSERSTLLRYALTAAGDYLLSGGEVGNGGSSLSIAPSITFKAANDWRFELSTTYSRDRATYTNTSLSNGGISSQSIGCYCNSAWSADLQANGSLLTLPAGAIKAAVGGGYRDNRLHGYRTVGTAQNLRASQSNHYAFAEINVPIASPDQQLPWIHRAEINAAGRYENYPGIGDVFTPKIAALLAANSDVEIKGSWGKSFRAPTLFMRYNTPSAQFVRGRSYGAGATSTDLVLLLSGGNRDLKPERATTWTASLALHPSWLSNARFEVGYFKVDYRDRIAQPITLASQALSNPAYADYISRAPSAAEVANAIEGNLFANFSGQPFDPALVSAIIYNTNRNVSRQKIQGVDFQAEYVTSLGHWGSLRLTGSGAYIESEQKVTELQAAEQLAGVLFNPPHFQGRAGGVWNLDRSSLALFVNYTGGLKDSRVTPVSRIPGMTTLDLTATTTIASGPAALRGLEVMLSAQNLFNKAPSLRGNTEVYDQPYDPTNYSPAGRVVSLSLRKTW